MKVHKEKLIPRIIVSPFVFGIMLCGGLFAAIRNVMLFIQFGGEYITLSELEDKESIKSIYQLLKEQNQLKNYVPKR